MTPARLNLAAALRAAGLLMMLPLGGPLPPAAAHVVFDPPAVEAGRSAKVVMRVGHGCDGSPVQALTVHLPPGLRGAKPLPKPGWTLRLEHEPVNPPYTWHGKTVTEELRRVHWEGGSLDDAHVDEFALVARMPDTPGPLAWRVTQRCARGAIDWAELATPEQPRARLKTPAPVLELRPPAPATPAAHRH